MFKPTALAALALVAFTPAAVAEGGKMVTLKHEYDAALLASDDGAKALLADLTRAAKRTCTSRVPALGGLYTDTACTDLLVAAAVQKIHADQLEEGTAMAPAFEKVALTQIASAN